MKIRLEGTHRDVDVFAATMGTAFDIRRQSADIPNRSPSPLVRRYLDIRLRTLSDAGLTSGADHDTQQAIWHVTTYLDALAKARPSDTIDVVTGGPHGHQAPGVYRRRLKQRDLRALLAEIRRLGQLLEALAGYQLAAESYSTSRAFPTLVHLPCQAPVFGQDSEDADTLDLATLLRIVATHHCEPATAAETGA